MSIGNTVSSSALRPELIGKDLYKVFLDNLYFSQAGMLGKKDESIIDYRDDLLKNQGDTITFGLTDKLSNDAITGDDELEGNEEKITSYSESLIVDQARMAVRLTGKFDEQRNAYDMRQDAKNKLAMQMLEFVERQIFLKLGGVNVTTLTDVNGTVVSGNALWSNSPDRVPNADTTAGYGSRYICADYTSGAASLATTDTLTPALIRRIRVKAETASPAIRKLRVNGKDLYVLFIHPHQKYDLAQDSTYAQAQREAAARGKDNVIFTGADSMYEGVLIHTHSYVPFLDIDVVGNNFYAAAAGTDISADCYRAILCGRQAIGFAKCKNDNKWVEATYDYKNKLGYSTSLIGGIQKIMFNSKEYGCCQLDTGATSQV